MIKEGDILFQIEDDSFEFFYIQPLVVTQVKDDFIWVEKDEEEFHVHRADIYTSKKDALAILIDLTDNSIKESQEKTKHLKELLKESKAELRNLKA